MRYGTLMAAPCSKDSAAGSGCTSARAQSVYCAYVPVNEPVTKTRSPAARPATSPPTTATSPAASMPGVYGMAGLRALVPARMYVYGRATAVG